MVERYSSAPGLSLLTRLVFRRRRFADGCKRGKQLEAAVVYDCKDGRGKLTVFDDRMYARLGAVVKVGDWSTEYDACKQLGLEERGRWATYARLTHGNVCAWIAM